ncbi:MAG: two-component system response regulator [Candidatus Levyibacteriota bacterium]
MDDKKVLLIVDDDKEFTDKMAEKALKLGFDAKVASSGKEALDYVAANKVDFIILDFVMPEMDGSTFYHVLTHDMRKNIPTVVLTTLSRIENSVEGLQVFEKSETDLDEFLQMIKNKFSPAPTTN